MPTPDQFSPDDGGSSRTAMALKAVARTRSDSPLRVVHPRRDRMWIDRDERGYTLALKGDGRLRFTNDALSQIAGLLHIGSALLGRLRLIDEDRREDCRLLNKMLWHEGASDSSLYRLRVHDESISAVFSGDYTPLCVKTLAGELDRNERLGRLRLARFTMASDGDLRVVTQYPRLPLVQLHQSKKANTRVEWVPGAILTNREDGSHAAVVVPAITSRWGTNALPVLRGSVGVSRRQHRGSTPAELAYKLAGDLLDCVDANFSAVGAGFLSLNRVRIPRGGVRTALSSMNLPAIPPDVRGALVRELEGRDTSYYWLLHSLLDGLDGADPVLRLNLEMAAGRLVWARGRLAN